MRIDEFLLARIAEDEDKAYLHIYGWGMESPSPPLRSYLIKPRILLECKAKRLIIELNDPYGPSDDALWEELASHEAQRILATLYADHPDFKEEWRHAEMVLDI